MTAPAPNRRRTAAEYASRDLAVLRDVHRYGVGLNALLAHRCFGGKEAGHVMRRLEAKGWVELHSAEIPGGVSYVTLTAAGGREIGRSVTPKPLSAVGFDAAVAVSWHCVFGGQKGTSRRLLPEESKSLLAGLATNSPHVLETDDRGRHRVLRVQLAAAGKPKQHRDRADRFFKRAVADLHTGPWADSGDLGLLVLGHTPQRVEQLGAAFDTDERFGDRHVVVALGPTTGTVAACLREQRNR